MPQARPRWLVRLVVLLVLGLILIVWATRREAEPAITVENQSGQPIAELHVRQGGEGNDFRDLAPGARVTIPLRHGQSNPLTVEGQLADGTLIRGRFGSAAGDGAALTVLPRGEIQFRPSGKSSPF